MRMGPLLLFLLLAIGLSFSVEAPELPDLGIEFLAIVILLSIVVVAMAAMIGEALQSPSITAWSKEQLREVAAGVVLVVLIWGATAGSTTMISAIFLHEGEGISDMPQLGEAALEPHIEYMEILYLKVADAYQAVGLLQGLSYFASMGGFWAYFGQGTSPYFGASVLMGPLSTAANNLTIQILTFRLIQVFCEYVSAVFPTFVLPIALAFRLFPFTRKMGNTLIAISLGALFIFPMSLMFVNEFWHATDWLYKEPALNTNFDFDHMELDMMDGLLSTVEVVCGSVVLRVFLTLGELIWAIPFAAISASACLTGYAFCFGYFYYLFVQAIWPLIATFIQLTIGSIVLTVVNVDLASGASPPLDIIPEILLPAVMEATGFSIISLLLVAMITFTGIKSISVALGGEYILYGVSRFV